MQPSLEGARTPYEVYCYDCRVTFPVGQKRCLHCGGRLGPRSETPFLGSGGRPGAGGGAETVGTGGGATGGVGSGGKGPGASRERWTGHPAPTGTATHPQEDEEEPSLALRRFGGLALWALIVVSALVSNLCGR